MRPVCPALATVLLLTGCWPRIPGPAPGKDGDASVDTDSGPCAPGHPDGGDLVAAVTGGLGATDPWGSSTWEAGLQGLWDQAPPPGEEAAVDQALEGAVVTAVLDADSYWLGDREAGIRTYAVTPPPFELQVGDRIDVRVLGLSNHHGALQIDVIDPATYALADEGAPVEVHEVQGKAVDYATLGAEIVHLQGEIVEDEGACGSAHHCWRVNHGDATTQVRLYAGLEAAIGTCVEVVAPVSVYDGQTQVDALRSEWVRTW